MFSILFSFSLVKLLTTFKIVSNKVLIKLNVSSENKYSHKYCSTSTSSIFVYSHKKHIIVKPVHSSLHTDSNNVSR